MTKKFKPRVVLLACIVLWAASGIGAAGIWVANEQSKSWKDCGNYRKDLGFALFTALFGPIGLVTNLAVTGLAENGWHLANRCEKEKSVILLQKFWTCTATYTAYVPPSSGTLTRFGRIGERSGYSEERCSQWSAQMTNGKLGGNATATEFQP